MGVAGADEVSDFDKYLNAIGKSRDTATDLDEIQWLRSERKRLRLADAEREAISVVADWASEHLGQDDPGVVALRALMERLK
jgi:hypothetical protein